VSSIGGLVIVFGAGMISFLLPCTLPLIPGYLSYISGIGADELRAGNQRSTVVGAASLFVLGFSLVFVSLGATASYIGSFLLPYRDPLTRVSGVVVVIMALIMIGLFQFPVVARDRRFHLKRDFGIWSSFPLGMAFAFGWSPCIGPVLASVLTYAASTHTAQKGAVLLLIYSLGLSVPFLGLALLAGRMMRVLARIRGFSRALNLGGAGVLLVMGVFLMLNQWTQVMAPLMRWYIQFGPSF